MKALGRGIVVVVSVACVLCNAGDSRAAMLDAVPALTLEGVWDSNVFNSSSGRSDFILTARPSLTFALQALRTTFNLQGAVTAEEYARYHGLDRVAAAKTLNLYPTDPIRVSPNVTVRPGAYFVEMVDFGRRAFADPVPGGPGTLPGVGADLTVVTGRTTTREYSGFLEGTYSPTENIETSVRGSGVRQERLHAPTSGTDFWVYGARGSMYYRLSPRLQAGPHVRYDKSRYDDGLNVQVYQGSLVARYVIREGQILEAGGGISYSRENTEPPVTATAPYGTLSLDSTWDSLHVVVSGEYGIEQGGIFRVPTRRFLGRLLMEKSFSPPTTAEIVAGYQRGWVGEPVVTEVATVYTASATLRYLVRTWATLHLGGRYFWQTSNVSTTRDLRRGSVFLGVDLSHSVNIF